MKILQIRQSGFVVVVADCVCDGGGGNVINVMFNASMPPHVNKQQFKYGCSIMLPQLTVLPYSLHLYYDMLVARTIVRADKSVRYRSMLPGH